MRVCSQVLVVLALVGLSGCSGMKPADFAAGRPPLSIESFFDGATKGTGLFEDRFGRVKRQMIVDIAGHWDEVAQELTLDEHFLYSDGEKQERVWHIHKIGPNQYVGRAGDVVGEATGESSGNSFHWNYDLDLKTDSGHLTVHLDDWMFLGADGTVLNRSFMSKLGVDLGSVTFAFRKG